MPFTSCPVVHSDSCLLAVNKPHGVLSHPNPGSPAAACAFEGRYDMKKEEFVSAEGTVYLMHRIDQDTSGVLLATLTETAAVACRAAFSQGQVRKLYLALVSGIPAPQGVWKDHLEISKGSDRVRARIRQGAPNAEMRHRVIASDYGTRLSLLEVELVTGRTHQIRAQSANRHHPVAGDDIYGNFLLNRKLKSEFGLRRIFLHALSVEFKHPQTGKAVKIEAPLPDDLEDVLKRTGVRRQRSPRR